MAKTNGAKAKNLLIWDIPTRVFHWLFVLSFASAYILSENDRFLYHHVYAGYLFFGLLVFRFFWGWIGSHYSRFRSFAHDWTSVWGYLKGLLSGEAARYIGHNPAGGWAIFAILVLALLSSITGFIVLGGEENHGPLAGLVGFDVGNAAKEAHELFANALLLVVFVHVGGVIVESAFHRENLVWSMITGYKKVFANAPSAKLYLSVGTLLLASVIGSGYYYFRGYLNETSDQPFRPFAGPTLADNATWRNECGDCHLAFHPNLLPARSWKRMMEEQSDHFGEDLSLEQASIDEITTFMVANAAEAKQTEAANRILRSISENESPQRFTETDYWKRQHQEIDERYWKSKTVKSKTNCGACHLDAKEGWFEDSNMRLPKLEN